MFGVTGQVSRWFLEESEVPISQQFSVLPEGEAVSTEELFADCTKGSSEQGLSCGPRESKTAPSKCLGQG